MNVIVVAAECAPWSKTGGLGDVVGSLPKALSCCSHNITDMEVGYFHTFKDGVDFVFINSSIFHAVASNIYGGSHEVMVKMHGGGVKTYDIALQSCHGGETTHLATDTWVRV
ncbi:unnamed protein product [Sphagnum compactum]